MRNLDPLLDKAELVYAVRRRLHPDGSFHQSIDQSVDAWGTGKVLLPSLVAFFGS